MNMYKENHERLFAWSCLIWDLANFENLNCIVHCVLCVTEYWCPPTGLCRLITQKITLCMWCVRKVIRLATLCTNRQCCCLPLHMAVRLTPAVDSVQDWTCYSCYAIVENVWSEVVFVRCVTKMDWQKFEQRCANKFCVKLSESATVTYEKLQRAYGEHSLSRAQVFRWHMSFLEGREEVEDEPRAGRFSTSKGWQCGKSEVSCEVRSLIDVENDQ